MSAPRVERHARLVERTVHYVLLAGVLTGCGLLVVGVALTLAGRGGVPATIPGLHAGLHDVAAWRPAGLYWLGLLTLILTPVVRVAGSVVAFAVEREWVFVAVTLAVLAIMGLTVWVGAT